MVRLFQGPKSQPRVSTNGSRVDFGMQTVKETEDAAWYGGYGPDQYVYYAQKGPKKFLGGTYLVESYSEIEK